MIIDGVFAPQKEHIPALRALWQEAFGDGDELLDAFFATAFSPLRARCIFAENHPVAALYWFDCEAYGKRLAYLYAVATAKTYRGQGLCRALIEGSCRALEAEGYAGAVLLPSNGELRTMYQKMGFFTCSHADLHSVAAADQPIAICEVNGVRYAQLRRQLLPPNGVLQQHESIAFLETQARLFAGEGFLLAAKLQNDQLLGLELLGDVRLAPHILCTLGCKRGEFRTPGGKEPMAMYRPLDGGDMPTLYFGLPFDL